MKNPIAIVNGVFMIGLLAGGAGMSAYVFATPQLRTTVTKPLPAESYIDGNITATIETTYEDELPIRNRSVAVLNAMTYALFGEGRKGVVIGRDGWLFSAEEYEWTPKSAANLKRNIAYISEVAATLRAGGVTLQIALVPEKADIYADHLMKARPAAQQGKYEDVRKQIMVQTGLDVPDLRQALKTASATAEMYFPTDTHWSVAGAGVAAWTLANDFPAEAQIVSAEFALKPEAPVEHEGDLKRFVELGPFSGLMPATETTVTPLVATAESGSVDDFLAEDSAAATPQIALVGTSYSASRIWSFEPQLKGALHADIVNYAEEGHGPIVPMREFMAKLKSGAVDVKAVIWEMPIRYLDDDPDADTKASSSKV
jgi:alginate O-acetyltransferase complex protein AlgJ